MSIHILDHWISQFANKFGLFNITFLIGYSRSRCVNRKADEAPHSHEFHQSPIAKDSGMPRAIIRFGMLLAISAFRFVRWVDLGLFGRPLKAGGDASSGKLQQEGRRTNPNPSRLSEMLEYRHRW